jgi:hypothetical protein
LHHPENQLSLFTSLLFLLSYYCNQTNMGLYNLISLLQTLYNSFKPLLSQNNHLYDDITAIHYFSFKIFFINIFQMSQTSNVLTEVFYVLVNWQIMSKKELREVMVQLMIVKIFVTI